MSDLDRVVADLDAARDSAQLAAHPCDAGPQGLVDVVLAWLRRTRRRDST